MKTTTTTKTTMKAQEQSEQLSTKQQKWNLFVGEEIYGFVHAASEAEALERVAAFKRPFRAVLAKE